MTFRAKPVVKRTHRPNWEADHRRNIYLNIGFGLVVLAALLILGAAAGASWYGDHWAAIAHVNGVGISKDDLSTRVNIDTYRLNQAEQELRSLVSKGQMTQTEADSRTSTLEQARANIPSNALSELIDEELQRQLASKMGVSVSDQQVTDALVKEATTPETRHVFMIAVDPSKGVTGTPTDTQKAAAKVRAETALSEIQGGQKFADVAKKMSDDTSASSGGDLGFISSSATIDTDFVAALFKLPVNGVTGVMAGADGIYRIGTVTQIVAPSVDGQYQQKIQNAGISLDAYKSVVKASVVTTALQDKVVAQLTTSSSSQRHVLEIFEEIPQNGFTADQAGTGDEVKVRHILFSPNHLTDPTAISALSANDPAWAAAKKLADDAYAKLKADPSQFAAIAEKQSDDTSTGANGGDLPYLTQSELDPSFASAVFKAGLKPNEILEPVKSQYGWHVIQFISRRPQAPQRMANVQTAITSLKEDFSTVAKEQSNATDAANGGDMGWIAQYQIDPTLEKAIFATSVGQTSTVVTTSAGLYLFKVIDVQTRKPDSTQITALKSTGWTNWYADQKAKASIQQDPNALSAYSSASPS